MLDLSKLLREADRQLTICNACRYCEDYCAVFPALERRAILTKGDIVYLANLCHDCRACYQACPYTAPHDFAVNIPATLSEVRRDTYRRYAWPRQLAAVFQRSQAAAVATGLAGLLLALGTIFVSGGWHGLTSSHLGPGAFYQVVPFLAMVIPGLVVSAFIVAVLWGGFIAFWRDTSTSLRDLLDGRAWLGALADAAALRYLSGGGPGCYYPEPTAPSRWRRVLHSLVFYGFLADIVSTTLAAIWQDFLDRLPPFPLSSPPLLFGIAGGVAMIIGTTGLVYLKLRSPASLGDVQMTRMDLAFLCVLDLASITGMLTLVFRSTPFMGTMLTVHLAVLVALYATAPYGKFVHFVYRVAALVLNRVELRREALRSPA